MQLNKEVYTVNRDNLIYDSSHQIDAKNISIAVQAGTAGNIKRGQIIDFKDGSYEVHAEGGTVSVIAAETTPYTADDTDISVPVYISGSFRKSECITDVELTEQDVEEFRSKGIYLK